MQFADLADEPCSISRSVAVLGERWTLVILKQAFSGTRRFDDFITALGISRSRLSSRLTDLVEHGLLERVEYFDNRTRFEYRLTERAHDLYPVLMALKDWGDAHLADELGPPWEYRHRGCGGDTHVRLQCDRCGEDVTSRDVEIAAGPGLTLPS